MIISHSIVAPEGLVTEVLGAHDLPEPLACALVSPGVNDSYRVDAGGETYFLRLYRAEWRTEPEIGWELELLRHLAQSGISVSVPVPRRDGAWLTPVAAPEGMRYAVLFTEAPGKVLEYVEADGYRYGCAAADLHGAMDSFSSDLPRFHLDQDHLVDEPLRLIRPYAERLGIWADYVRLADGLRDRLLRVEGGLERSICHGDLHGHNVHQTDDHQLTFFDFDCGGPGWRAYDLAVYRWAVSLHAKNLEPWEAFLRGYRSRRDLNQADLDAVPVFVGLRTLWLVGLQARFAPQRGTAWAEGHVDWGLKTMQKWNDIAFRTDR